ncbi:hypothetical protein [Chryseosolibacter indicus]|nr:hypothetical protein [Chryseosolibacter indicus]
MVVILVVYALFLLWVPFLPFIDLPNHLAEATIYKFYNEPGNVLSQYYQPTPWYYPNTFHTVFCSLFPSVEVGNKIFHILYIALLLYSIYLVIKQLGGNVWYGLLSVLFIFNYNVTYGFVGFAISIPVIIILFYFTLRDIDEDKLSLKISIAFLLVLLFLMHAQNALFAMVIYGVLMLYKYFKKPSKLLIHAALIPLPMVALILTWWFKRTSETKEESTIDFLFNYYTTQYFPKLHGRIRLITLDNFQLQEGLAGLIIAILIFSCLLIPFLFFKSWRPAKEKLSDSNNLIYSLIFFLAGAGCYFILPDGLPGQSPLFQRFCTIVILSAIILGSLFLNKVTLKGLRIFILTAISIYSVLWFEYIYSFNQTAKDISPDFFEGIDNKNRLAGLIYENSFRGRRAYLHFPNYYIVWNQGIAASKIIDYRFGVVRRAANETTIPFYYEYIGEPWGATPVPQYSHLEYVLVRGQGPVQRDVNLNNFELTKEQGSWKLYRNKGEKHVLIE